MDDLITRMLTASPMRDVVGPGDLQIEMDLDRGVVYVHADGITVLRVCDVKVLRTTVKHYGVESNETVYGLPQKEFR